MSPPFFNSLLESAFAWALQTSLAALVLVGLILCLLVLFSKVLTPRWRYTLWLLVVVRLLLPAVPSSSLSVFNVGSFSLATKPGFISSRAGLSTVTPARTDAAGTKILRENVSTPVVDGASVAPAGPKPVWTLSFVARWLWLAGACGYFLLVGFQHRKLATWIRRQTPVATPRITALVEAAQAVVSVRGPLPVIVLDAKCAPAIFGHRQPRLLISQQAFDSLDDRGLRLVILHELIHIRRRDVLLNWAGIVAQGLHWFNPVVWFALKRWRAERELVCDAKVLSLLSVDDRHAYGGTLLKLVGHFSGTPLAASVTSMFHTKPEIERRIIMIAQYQTASRLAIAIGGILVATLCVATFTRAAEKSVPTKPAEEAKARALQGIDKLEQAAAEADVRTQQMEQRVDKLRNELNISDYLADVPSPTLEAETVRKLDASRTEAKLQYTHWNTTVEALKKLSRSELRKAAPIVAPDEEFMQLFITKAKTEQTLADLSVQYAPDHPDVKRAMKTLDTIEKQINDKLDAVLFGLEFRAQGYKTQAEMLEKALIEAKRTDIDNVSKYRPYYTAKRDLEQSIRMRDALRMKLITEKVETALESEPLIPRK
jgi:beta-lactamase regulating signal transducer with metallopeptidase domain